MKKKYLYIKIIYNKTMSKICDICKDELGEDKIILNCNHEFHSRCYNNALLVRNHPSQASRHSTSCPSIQILPSRSSYEPDILLSLQSRHFTNIAQLASEVDTLLRQNCSAVAVESWIVNKADIKSRKREGRYGR